MLNKKKGTNYIDYSIQEKVVNIYLIELRRILKESLGNIDSDCSEVKINFQYFEKPSSIPKIIPPSPYVRVISISCCDLGIRSISSMEFKLALGCIRFFRRDKRLNHYTRINLKLHFEGGITKLFHQVKICRIKES